MHRDHVPTVPDTFQDSSITLLGSTPSTPNQGYLLYRPSKKDDQPLSKSKSIQVFSVQGHPEFTQKIIESLVEARGPNGNGAMNAEVANESRERAAWRNDGDTVVGKVIWDVLSSKA